MTLNRHSRAALEGALGGAGLAVLICSLLAAGWAPTVVHALIGAGAGAMISHSNSYLLD